MANGANGDLKIWNEFLVGIDCNVESQQNHCEKTSPFNTSNSLKTNRRVNTSQILAVQRWELYMACATKQPTSLIASYLKLPQISITRFYTLRVQPENFEWHEIIHNDSAKKLMVLWPWPSCSRTEKSKDPRIPIWYLPTIYQKHPPFMIFMYAR